MRSIRSFLWLLALFVLAAPFVPLHAQNANSRLVGTVHDAQHAVLPGVTVTATSPALIGSQTAISESNGTYQFPALPAGTYTLTFTLQGFQTIARDQIVLSTGQTLTVDADLPLDSVKEQVTVTAQRPVVDTQSTAVGNVLNTAKLTTVPSSTDLWGALAQTPGVRMSAFDVGGSHKVQSSGYDAFGVSGQARVVTEGVDTTEGTSGAGFYQDYYANNEVAVSAAGQDVTMNTPGALIVVTVKSGGNQFKALVNQTYENQSFVGDNTDDSILARGGSAQPNLLFWETHGDVGGPILKDKLWFFVSRNHFHIDEAISGVPQEVATNLGIVDDFTDKETWKPSTKDTLIGYYQWQHKQAPLRGLSVNRGPQSTLAQSSYAWMYNGRWQRIWTNRLFTELNVGEWGYDFPQIPRVDYKQFPPRTDLATGVDTGVGFTQGGTAGPFVEHPAKPQAYGTVTYYLPTTHAGSHDLKAGFEWMNEMWTDANNGQSGPLVYLDFKGQPDEIRLTDLGDPSQLGSTWTVPIDGDHKAAIYAQDRWAANSHLTVTAGLRYDRQQPYYTSSKRAPVLSDIFPAATTPGLVLFTRNNLAPRVGVSVDPQGDGRTAVKAFYGRYYYNFSDTLSAVDPGGVNTRTYQFDDLNGNSLYDGPQELGTLLSSTGGSSTTYNADLPTPYADEIDLSVQRQLWGESAIRLAYVRKMERDNYSTFNQLRVGQFTVPVTVPVTLEHYNQVVEGVQGFTVYDIPSSLKGQVQNIIDTTPGDSGDPGGAATFDTFELAFNKRFEEGLFLDSSFDWTRLEQLHNANSTYQNVYPTVPGLQVTSQWEFHLSSRYTLPHQIGVGANFEVQSGPNYARVISVTLPNSGTQKFYLTDFSENHQDTVPYLSLRLDKAVNFGRHRLTGMLDLFNVLNANPVTGLNTSNGSLYNQITSVLAPRTLEIGARFEF